MPAVPWAADALLALLRWLHSLAAVVFLGWTLVRLWGGLPAEMSGSAVVGYREVTELTLLVFLATGAVLTFDRLSHGAGTAYAVVLALKVLLAAVAYQLAFRWRRGGLQVPSWDGRIVALALSGAILLAAVLMQMFERGAHVES